MLYRDPFSKQDYLQLTEVRALCFSIYLPTSRVTQDTPRDRITLKNLIDEATSQAGAIADKRQVAAVGERLQDLLDDDDFWAHQANGLAVLATPERIASYRLAFDVEPIAEVSDRFHLKPMLAALAPKSAYVLAISQKSVHCYEFTPAQQLEPVRVEGLPKDFSDATGRTLQRDGAPARRLEGDEGKKVLQRKFIRAVEQAMRPLLKYESQPLVLATTTEQQAMYSEVNTYPELQQQAYHGSVENMPLPDLAEQIKPIVDQLHAARLHAWGEDYRQSRDQSRSINDLQKIATASTFGQVSKLLVDADHFSYGTIDDKGVVSLAAERSPETYDLIDEIAARVVAQGGDVLAVRADEEIAAELRPVAAILRWA